MMDGITAGGQSFMQSLEDMVRRLERVERIVTLIAAPVLPYKHLMTREAFYKYLEARCSSEYLDKERPWKAGYTGEFTHKTTGTEINLSQVP